MDAIIKSLRFFCQKVVPELTNEEWQAFEESLSFRKLKKGELLLKEGDLCRHVSFIHKGLVRFFYLVDGREVTTGFVAENQFSSDYASFLKQSASTKNIDALEDVECADISYQAIQSLYQRFPVYQIFGRRMAEQMFIAFDQDNSKLTTMSPEERYLRLLNNQSPLLQRVPLYLLASYLGVTPEHLSRIRKKVFR